MTEQFPTAIPLAQIAGGLSIETTLNLLTETGQFVGEFDVTLRIAYDRDGDWFVESVKVDDVAIDHTDAIMWAVIRRAVSSKQTHHWISQRVESYLQEAA